MQHLAYTARQTEARVKKAREAHNKQEKQKLEERRGTDRRMVFRCSKCTSEIRRPDQMSRAANGGLCCAFGIGEFAEMEKKSGYKPPQKKPDFANEPRVAPKLSREQRFPELRYMTSTEKARDDAKAAANQYGWDRTRRGSVDLEPKLVTGYVNHPGNGTNVLGTAPLPPQPKYQDLGIDFTVWRQMQDVKLGAHGRIPPPPEKPLPVRPLQLRQKREHTVPRKPVASRAMAPPSSVSPLSSKSKPSKALRRQSSILNGELHDLIDGAMLDYQPAPESRYRY
jgi:hypothetical protein